MNKIATLRSYLNLSQAAFAELLNPSKTHIATPTLVLSIIVLKEIKCLTSDDGNEWMLKKMNEC